MTTVASPLSSAAGLSLSPRGQTDGEKLSATARQFEAIFVRQMLASARATDFGGDDVFGQMDQTFVEMRDERFAEIASQTGALGLAAQIERHLAAQLPAQAPATAGDA